MAERKSDRKIITQNKKATHDYFVDERYEAGIELYGTEVKSIRAGGINLKDSYCHVEGGELFHCKSPYPRSGSQSHGQARQWHG